MKLYEILIIALFCGFIVYRVIRSFDKQKELREYTSLPHYHVDANAKLSTTAKITYTHSSVVGYKGFHRLETVVKFDDGFTYTSFKTEVERLFGYDKLKVSRDLQREIINDALEAHECIINGKPIPNASELNSRDKDKTAVRIERPCTTKQQKRLYVCIGVLLALTTAFIVLKIFNNA